MTSGFSRFRRPVLLGGVVASLFLIYNYRHELIGDLTEDKAALLQQTDQEGAQKIKNNIRERQAGFFKGLVQGKNG